MPSEIASNGQDLGLEIDGIDADLHYAVRSRALSWHGREFYNPDFGMDLINPDDGLVRRVRTSLAQIRGWRLDPTIRVTESGAELRISPRLTVRT